MLRNSPFSRGPILKTKQPLLDYFQGGYIIVVLQLWAFDFTWKFAKIKASSKLSVQLVKVPKFQFKFEKFCTRKNYSQLRYFKFKKLIAQMWKKLTGNAKQSKTWSLCTGKKLKYILNFKLNYILIFFSCDIFSILTKHPSL